MLKEFYLLKKHTRIAGDLVHHCKLRLVADTSTCFIGGGGAERKVIRRRESSVKDI